jgi:multidrug efflux pump subunit AcrA (membrane-fusion protein)
MDKARMMAEEARMSAKRERPRILGNQSQGDEKGRKGKGGAGSGGASTERERPRLTGMDVQRAPKSKRKKYLMGAAAAVAIILITFALSQLEPAAPTVDRNVIVLGTVERGDMVREVRGSGTLVPERVQFVAALTAGRVVARYFEPGETVSAEDVIVSLANPDVELQVLQAEQQWTAAKASLVSIRQNLGSGILTQEAAVARADADYADAQREAEAYEKLVDDQLVSENEYRRAQENVEAVRVRHRTEQDRLVLLIGSRADQLAVQNDQISRLYSIYEYQRDRAASMEVRAGADGVLQDFDLEVGQWVQSGTTLARVAKPDQLKAELRIPQTQARDVAVGQLAMIDTRTDTIPGRVRRINPNVQGGSVLVEIRLEGDLPAGARSDLTIDGTIQLELLENVLHVGRPVYGQSNSRVSLFKVIEGGDAAERVIVQLGQASVNEIEVIEGLAVGDGIILSDMSRYDNADRVRIR